MYCAMPKVLYLSRRINVEAVPAVVRFDKLSSGRSVPVVEGAVIFKRDLQALITEYKEFLARAAERKRRKEEKLKKQAQKRYQWTEK